MSRNVREQHLSWTLCQLSMSFNEKLNLTL